MKFRNSQAAGQRMSTREAASATLAALRGDVAIYARDGGKPWWARAGFWAGATYRVGASAHHAPAELRWGLLAVHRLLAVPWRLFKGVHIPHDAAIGPGLRIPHPQNILIAPGAVLGRDCSVYHDVTLGRGSRPGVPSLGDRVMLFPGSRVLGGVRIGDDARIGANAVVQRHVPPGASVATPACRVVPASMTRRGVGRPMRPIKVA